MGNMLMIKAYFKCSWWTKSESRTKYLLVTYRSDGGIILILFP